MEHYRIVDADYAIIGVRADIGHLARRAADALRDDGIRTGAIIATDLDSITASVIHLLAQVKAVGVFECAITPSRFVAALSERFATAADGPEWPFSLFVPRVYSARPANRELVLQEGHLIGVVKAMREYAPDRLMLTANGIATPALSDTAQDFVPNVRTFDVPKPSRSTARRIASVA